jgi:hypothetical protein
LVRLDGQKRPSYKLPAVAEWHFPS